MRGFCLGSLSHQGVFDLVGLRSVLSPTNACSQVMWKSNRTPSCELLTHLATPVTYPRWDHLSWTEYPLQNKRKKNTVVYWRLLCVTLIPTAVPCIVCCIWWYRYSLSLSLWHWTRQILTRSAGVRHYRGEYKTSDPSSWMIEKLPLYFDKKIYRLHACYKTFCCYRYITEGNS